MIETSRALWVKICGIRDVETARRVAELGADAIGLNFYNGSPRCVADVASAAEIVATLPETTVAVGVFVNYSAAEIHEVCGRTGLHLVQLHGDEPDSMLDDLVGLRVIRAVRVSANLTSEMSAHVERLRALSSAPESWLLDARVASAYGGTGHALDWDLLTPAKRDGWLPLILAGGLTPDNIRQAIRIVRPFGVDVASGVESAPGVKDLKLVERFITSCRTADNLAD